jgi:hypothetical protein
MEARKKNRAASKAARKWITRGDFSLPTCPALPLGLPVFPSTRRGVYILICNVILTLK